ncbi:hypothetical protein H1D32_20825 [Anaerobacillus sp. CMMVII]|uniref:rhamnogalacturonan acetylesterase n=1 Tax=Anaerobacillus sp. CMMVII TaxID=2755588 RepID=UPI0021B7BEE5|nr:rhamnogalacturonan acetylesterase [Anaerobacillus sp. CMMVII]MCT8139925.1 hypothetical protein [Anaerobacillus sp. CMMVII]
MVRQHFIFGIENPDYTVINSNTRYNQVKGYGLEYGTFNDDIKSTSFRANVNAGEDYLICVKVNRNCTIENPLFINDVEISKEWLQEEDSSMISFRFAAIESSLYFEIPLVFEDLCELSLSPIPKRTASKNPSIYLISDSTVKTYGLDQSPMAGWGQVIHRFFNREIKVDNRAMGGRSTKLAYKEGRLNDLLVDIKPGDYMFIQFAHNDMAQGKPERYVTIEQYKDYLNNKYIKGALQRGGTPVCLTSMNRRTFDNETKTFVDSFPTYTQAMREVANENKLTLLDLNQRSLAFYNSLGLNNTDPLFMQLRPGEHSNYLDGLDDNTHFREAGAKQMARMVIEEINHKLPALSSYTLNPQSVLNEVFADTMNYWARDQVELMARLGIMAEEPDGFFHPEADITVGTFFKALGKITDHPDLNSFKLTIDNFLDLHTASSVISQLGYADVSVQFLLRNSEEHDYRLTKGEVAAILYKLYFHIKIKEHTLPLEGY